MVGRVVPNAPHSSGYGGLRTIRPTSFATTSYNKTGLHVSPIFLRAQSRQRQNINTIFFAAIGQSRFAYNDSQRRWRIIPGQESNK